MWDWLPSSEVRDVITWIGGGVSALVAAAWVVFRHFSDRTAMRKHRTAVDREFPERNFRQRLRLLCEELRDHLDRIDSETNWSHRHCVPLDAEVDILKGERRRRRVIDLFAGIRRNRRSKLFLVLGDPGSGKTVALRKLCRDLLQEVDRTGKLPIYVNLREWASAAAWTREDPPTEDELRDFVFKNIRERLSNRSKAFLDTCFHKMLDHGRLFLVLDSFDEIPRVMDAGEASWLIGELSQVMTRLLVGGNDGRGVVASRHFRRPRFTREDRTILEIRPFSEVKIAAAIDRSTPCPDAIKRGVFAERPDLAPIARNPFALGLMIDYWEAHPGKLPRSQAELYESFVGCSLDLAEEDLRRSDLGRGDVLACASAIAREMFGSDRYGLEIPIATLREQLPNMPVSEVVKILRGARIGRASTGQVFSFVHRRFAEYFLIDTFRERPDALPLQAIPTDSRRRDALVLYAEVAEEPVAKSIAERCWEEICAVRNADVGSDAYRRGLHSLRFVASAFQRRRHLLAGFEPDLARQIYVHIREAEDPLVAKHALEAAGVLSDENTQATIAAALASGNPWLIETAFRACRYLRALPWKTRFLIMDYLLSIPPVQHLKTYREVMLSLETSEGLDAAKWFYRLRHWDVVAFVIACIIFFVSLPSFGLILVVTSFVCLLLFREISYLLERNRDRDREYEWISNAIFAIQRRCRVSREEVISIASRTGLSVVPSRISEMAWLVRDPLRFLNVVALISIAPYQWVSAKLYDISPFMGAYWEYPLRLFGGNHGFQILLILLLPLEVRAVAGSELPATANRPMAGGSAAVRRGGFGEKPLGPAR